MTNAVIDLANDLLRDGFGLRVDGEKLLVAPPHGCEIDEVRTSALRRHKADLVALLKSTCSRCRRPLEAKTKACWHCFTRPCEVCGRDSGSCFIATCIVCGNQLKEEVQLEECQWCGGRYADGGRCHTCNPIAAEDARHEPELLELLASEAGSGGAASPADGDRQNGTEAREPARRRRQRTASTVQEKAPSLFG